MFDLSKIKPMILGGGGAVCMSRQPGMFSCLSPFLSKTKTKTKPTRVVTRDSAVNQQIVIYFVFFLVSLDSKKDQADSCFVFFLCKLVSYHFSG